MTGKCRSFLYTINPPRMNMSILVAVALQAFATTSVPVSFDDALLKKQITASAKSNENSTHYQQPMLLEIKNITASEISVDLPVGRYFQSEDTTDQNFVSTEPLVVTLTPGQTKHIPVSAMCVNHHKSAPEDGQVYAIKKQAAPKLLKTAQYIQQNKLYGSYLGQTIMWCVSDNEPLESVFGYVNPLKDNIFQFLSGLTGKPIPPTPKDDDYLRNPKAKPKIEVSGFFEYEFAKSKAIHIAMFDEQNIAVRELYNNPNEPEGSHKVDYVFDASVFYGGKYYIRFLSDNRILMEQEVEL